MTSEASSLKNLPFNKNKYHFVAIVLVILAIVGGMHGVLLWPTVLLHAVIGAAMLAAFFR